MSGITSGVGIFSGIDTRSLIDQLITVEARPRAAAQLRLTQLQAQQAAILDLNSRLLSLSSAATSLRKDSIFDAAKAESSQASVLSATAGANATLGSFNFIVDRLVSTHQQISRGFADKDRSALGLSQITFEIGGGRVDSSTALAELNGGLGVDRGKIRITDSAGASAEVDLSTAATINDVLDAINSAGGIAVTASAEGYALRLDGVQKVENVFGSQTATSLGIDKTAVAGVITGDQVHALSANTPLALLRDGAGVAFLETAGNQSLSVPVADFEITVGATQHDIVLGQIVQNDPDPNAEPGATVIVQNAASTLGDLFSIINSQTNGEVTAAVSADGARIELTSTVGSIAVSQGPTARPTAGNLGLLGQPAGATVTSTRLLAGLNSRLTGNLNGGSGLTATDLAITARNGSVFNLTLNADGSVADIIDAVNTGTAGAVTATLNSAGNGLILTDTTTGATTFQIAGGAATDLGLTGSFTTGVADSGNLQSAYIGEATLLDDLNAGAGIGTGSFIITDSAGVSSTVNIGSSERTVFDLITKINGAGNNVTARVNDTGDGVIVEDAAGGALALRIEDSTGTVARRLNLVGQGDPAAANSIDGSFEQNITLDPTDTLDAAVNKISAAGIGVDASIINDGFGANPFRLIITSKTSGTIGQVTVDTGGIDLGLSDLTTAQDAVVFFGSTDPANAILLTSSSNTVSGAIGGVTLDLRSTSATPVEINITRDTATIEESLQAFVDAYNEVLDRTTFHGRFNVETKERGALLGDGVILQIERALQTTVQNPGQNVQSQFSFLFEAGVSVGTGGQLEFDSEKFRQALTEDPAGVAELFAGFKQEPTQPKQIAPGVTVANTDEVFSKLGVLEIIAQVAESFTDSIDGQLTSRKNTFDTQIGLQQKRIDSFTVQLDQKRSRLERQFAAMEQALAQLSAQQSALGALSAGLGG